MSISPLCSGVMKTLENRLQESAKNFRPFFAYLTSKLQIYQGFDQPFTCHATQTYLRSRLSISSSFTSAAPVLSHVDFFQEHRNTK